ncbi:MAG TPA: universal stress protein [Chitinophagaceae bacterium]|nr:universal stress protein [Chitinophagaceae bacterium]
MHRVIIPVDFSQTSLNAARFASQMLAGKKDAVVVLYNNYETSDDHDICMNYLESLKREFLRTGVEKVELEQEMGGDLTDNISRLAHTSRATLIVMGISGKSALKQAMFGSNTLKLVDKNLYPVMIIPPDAVYKGINNVAFASDFKRIKETTPSELINAVLEMFNPRLHIVNVNPGHYISLSEEIQLGKEEFKKMFSKWNTEFYFIARDDFFEALDDFVKDYAIDIIITIPRHQSNSTSLVKSTHTKQLAYHSHIPILAAHE